MNKILCASVALLLFSACTKADFSEKALNGKWKLVEVFDGYAMGGNFRWNPVPESNATTLEFKPSGSYIETDPMPGGAQRCLGTYSFNSADSVLTINSNCQTVTVRKRVTELTGNTLILNIQVIEGIIRYKHIRVD